MKLVNALVRAFKLCSNKPRCWFRAVYDHAAEGVCLVRQLGVWQVCWQMSLSPQSVLWTLWSHLSLNESHLLCFWCGSRGEQSETRSREDSWVYVALLSPACVSGSLKIYSVDPLSHCSVCKSMMSVKMTNGGLYSVCVFLIAEHTASGRHHGADTSLSGKYVYASLTSLPNFSLNTHN